MSLPHFQADDPDMHGWRSFIESPPPAESSDFVVIGCLPPDLCDAAGLCDPLVRVSAPTVHKQVSRHPEVSPDDYVGLAVLFRFAQVTEEADGRLVFVGDFLAVRWKAVVKHVPTRGELYLLSFHRSNERTIRAASRRALRRLR
jgi:hypothetical protein